MGDPSAVVSSNNTYVTATNIPNLTATDPLAATGFGFTIPTVAGTTIRGILVEIEGKDAAPNNEASLHTVFLTKTNTATVGTDQEPGTALGSVDAYFSYGGPTSLWGTTWTPTEINSANFGVWLQCMGQEASNLAIASIDHMRITVYYGSLHTATTTATLAQTATTRAIRIQQGRSAATLSQVATTQATRTQQGRSAASLSQVATSVVVRHRARHLLLDPGADGHHQRDPHRSDPDRERDGIPGAGSNLALHPHPGSHLLRAPVPGGDQRGKCSAGRDGDGGSIPTRHHLRTPELLRGSVAAQGQTSTTVAGTFRPGSASATQPQVATSLSTRLQQGSSTALQGQLATSVGAAQKLTTATAAQAQVATTSSSVRCSGTSTALQAQVATTVGIRLSGGLDGEATASQPQTATTRATLTTRATSTSIQAQSATTISTRTLTGSVVALQSQVATSVGGATRLAAATALQGQLATSVGGRIQTATSAALQSQPPRRWGRWSPER